MSRGSRQARSRARRTRRESRYLGFILATFALAFVVSLVFRGTIADGLDAILGLDSSQSARSAALLGWAAGFSLLIYGLVVSLFKNPFTVFRWTWPVATLLIVPTFAFTPGRSTVNRADDIATEYFFLGSFFDTYYLAIFAFLSIIAAMVVQAFLAPREHLEPEVLDELDKGPYAGTFDNEPRPFDRARQWKVTVLLRRVLVRAVTAGWVVGVFVYALTF